ncbi:rhomboid family intramembrane serine protease [Ohtaekwangia koreensis]|uniref:Rhomboid family protein n=1 Tax=Ohtaekwangia koreensis TaxID=688867 RepID=A0A1T5MGX5_9BACT|nr:rhomboid family intramembrane serine protease [Ohtaekwangia koreensis]SKC87158.1 Rhomboid family protein [Ohtaekwangia koreensis]
MEQPIFVTYIIIGVTVLISFLGYSNEGIVRQLIMNPYQISKRQQYYRFVTSGFLHADHMHLFFNMFSLYFFGITIEQIFSVVFGSAGPLYFITLYILGIIVSDIPSFLKHRNNPGYNALGASGGVAAVIFASIIFQPLANIYIYFVPVPGFILGIGYLIFSWYQGRKANDNVNHDAHLYGALFGFLFCAVLYPPSLPYFVEQIKNWDVLSKYL